MSSSQLQPLEPEAPAVGGSDRPARLGGHAKLRDPDEASGIETVWGRFKVYAVPVKAIGPRNNPLGEALYRIFEKICALIGLIFGLPIMLIEGFLIRRESPGPALFHHRRIAQCAIMRGGELRDRKDLRYPSDKLDPNEHYFVPQSFHFVKFRTMYADARERFPELYNYSLPRDDFFRSFSKSGGVEDPRITPLGRVLRALTLDELPNFWSVLTGDMRLVGPRPDTVEVAHAYAPEEMYKFVVKPGITGLAQINGRGLLSRGETLEWDLEYVRTRTVWLDLKILCRTFWLVVTRHGAF